MMPCLIIRCQRVTLIDRYLNQQQISKFQITCTKRLFSILYVNMRIDVCRDSWHGLVGRCGMWLSSYKHLCRILRLKLVINHRCIATCSSSKVNQRWSYRSLSESMMTEAYDNIRHEKAQINYRCVSRETIIGHCSKTHTMLLCGSIIFDLVNILKGSYWNHLSISSMVAFYWPCSGDPFTKIVYF